MAKRSGSRKGAHGSVIARCSCWNTYQNEHYGSFMRVQNKCIAGRTGEYRNIRCTACGRLNPPVAVANAA